MMSLYKATKADLFRFTTNDSVLIKSSGFDDAVCSIAKIETLQDQNSLIVLLKSSSLILERLAYLKFLQITAIFQDHAAFDAKLSLAQSSEENESIRCMLELENEILESYQNFPMFLT